MAGDGDVAEAPAVEEEDAVARRVVDAIRAILRNPRYTGFQVWNRQRRDEVLTDVENVAEGTRSNSGGMAAPHGCGRRRPRTRRSAPWRTSMPSSR